MELEMLLVEHLGLQRTVQQTGLAGRLMVDRLVWVGRILKVTAKAVAKELRVEMTVLVSVKLTDEWIRLAFCLEQPKAW